VLNGVNIGAFGVGCGPVIQVIHVSTTGSDDEGNGSENNPYASINHAIQNANYTFIEDIYYADTIVVHDGIYMESIDNIPAAPDYWNSSWYITSENGPEYTRIQATASENTINTAYSGVSFNGFQFDGFSYGEYGSYTRFENCLITGSQDGGASTCGPCLIFYQCTLIDNELTTFMGNGVEIKNSIFVDNPNYQLSDWDIVSYTLNDLGLNENGNISGLNPLFCNPDSGDYSLAENSPALGSGEGGANMGAFGVGCEALILAPVLTDISDHQIEEDGDLIIDINATSDIGASMTFFAESDTSSVITFVEYAALIVTPEPDWYGTANVTVMVTDENELSDTTDFTLTVTAVNDSPEAFSVLYPTVSDTFSTHVDSDTAIVFNWEESYDVDSDVTYRLTIELEFFGNTYTDIHENITDTTISVSSNSLDALLGGLNINESILTYIVEASDEEYTIQSNAGTFFLSRASLGTINKDIVPEVFALHQNYPNPFNPVTSLRYDLPEDGLVNITVYDMMGRVVKTLINSSQTAGFKSIQWNATNDRNEPVSAGLYLYTIQAGEFRQTKKMVLLK